MNKFYEIFEIMGRRFMFFPTSMMLFESNKNIEEIIKTGFMSEDDNLTDDVKHLVQIEKQTQKCLQQVKPFSNQINSVQINMINACNMRCKYCFADNGTHHKNNVMTESQAKLIIEYAFQNIKENMLSVVIIGGEPMLNMPIFEYILKYCRKKAQEKKVKVRFATTTNGTLIDEANLQLLDSYNVVAMVSQDSCDKNINDHLRSMADDKLSQFEILKEKKKLFLNSNKKRAVHITVTPFNKKFAETAIQLYKEGFYHVHLDFVKSNMPEFKFEQADINLLKDQFDILTNYILECIDNDKVISCHPLTDDIKRIHCRIPRIHKCNVLDGLYAFSPEGTIYPCDVLMYEEYEIGNIYSGINEEKIDNMRKNTSVLEECSNCWIRYICGGKCLAEVLNNAEENDNFICSIRRHMVKLTLYLYYYIQKENPNYLKNYLNVK